jgi:hypothetical protein
MAARNVSVFIDEVDDVFASPNADYIPTIPSLQSVFSDDCDPIDCLKTKFDQNEYPYIGFAPMDLRCKGVVFGRLDLSKFDSLIEQVPGTTRWRTVPGLAILWRRLEEALIMMGTVVTEKSAARYVPLEYKLPPFPATFGYLRDHATSRYAMKAVRRSRSAFIPLVAWCACAFASAGDLRSYTPRWYRLLEDSGRVHQEWLNEMARNEIGDFSGNVKRVGVFVHLARCAWLSIIQVYINANVPIWFYWGNTRHGFVQNYDKNYDKWLQGYRPSPAAISDAIRKNQHQRETANRPDESPDDHPQVGAQDPLAPPESKFPRPVKHSGQPVHAMVLVH